MNQHKHTKACRKYSSECRFSFPKFPVWKTLIARPWSEISDKDKENYRKILHNVKEVLLNEELVESILQQFDKDSESKKDFYVNREKRI